MKKFSTIFLVILMLAVVAVAGAQGSYPDPGTTKSNTIISAISVAENITSIHVQRFFDNS